MTSLRMNRTVVLALVFASRGSVYAQSGAATSTEVRASAFQNLITLPGIGSSISPGFSATFDATADEKVGRVAIVIAPKHRDDFTFSISASGPVNETTKTATPLTLDGLTNSSKASAGLNWFLWRGKPNIAAGKAICQRNVERDECDDYEIKDPDERILFLRSQAADTDPITIDIAGEYARTQFTYLTPAVFTETTDSHSNATFTATLGRYTPSSGYIWGGYEFAHSWTPAGAPRQICTPLATIALDCVTAAIGAPKLKDQHLVEAGLRRFLFHGRAAIDPTLEWNPKDRIAALTFPVYGFTKKNEGLAGGVKVGWRSDTNDVAAVIFVGTAIGILR